MTCLADGFEPSRLASFNAPLCAEWSMTGDYALLGRLDPVSMRLYALNGL